MPKDCVDIKAFNAQETLVFHQIYSTERWYEELHPIIDSGDFRKRYGIIKVEGTQYDAEGNQERWHSTCAPDGSLLELRDLI
jgi:hypothetical protein